MSSENGVEHFQFDLTINPKSYLWTARVLRFLRKLFKVNIKLHDDHGQLAAGDIFLFNHFARFETFIPQYLIYERTGAFCRSVAARELFLAGDPFTNYLLSVGAVPDDFPGLLPFLAAEILRGRKLIVFPEGGMVKDRRVLDPGGQYSVYSRTAERRRKHHTGAAVAAMAVDVFKKAVLSAHEAGDQERLDGWVRALQMPGRERLLEVARKPTVIVPANITFYPLRVRGNLLQKGVELFKRKLNRRAYEELLIEGNILLKETDMDIRLAEPVCPRDHWGWWERHLVTRLARGLHSLDQIFALRVQPAHWVERLFGYVTQGHALRVRDAYMRAMYQGVTIHLSHLASLAILHLVATGRDEVAEDEFHRILYLAVKQLQQGLPNQAPAVPLHRSLLDPATYGDLLRGRSVKLAQFLRTATTAGLVDNSAGCYRFLPKLRAEHAFDEIRIENPVAVYANEAAPVGAAVAAVKNAIARATAVNAEELAHLRFDDELLAQTWAEKIFSRPRHQTINAQQTRTHAGTPFLFLPPGDKNLGVVLIHGFLASPAEVRELGEELAEAGYRVIGVRLQGHATSPWDLRERTRQDWLDSVRRGYEILTPFAAKICLVGFSAGGLLALRLAAEGPAGLAAVVPISAPMRFVDRNMMFVPLVHGANRLVATISPTDGLVPFRLNESENPHINYRHIPIGALYELACLVDEVAKSLAAIQCPALIIQGSDDPVVDPRSAGIIHDGLGSTYKQIEMITASRHGILYHNVGAVRAKVLSFLHGLDADAGQPAHRLLLADDPALAGQHTENR